MGIYNKTDVDEVLNLVHLNGIGKKVVGHFSLGMKQRLALARAMITFGMRKKSTVHTVVAAVIVAMINCSNGAAEMDLTSYFKRFLIVGDIVVLSVLLSVGHTLNNVDSTDMA